MNQIRAPKGGVVGMNGLQYDGGCFLPSTKLGKMAPRGTASGRPERPRGLIDGVKGLVAFSFDRMHAEIYCSDYSLNFYGRNRVEVQAIVDRYNAGER